MGRPVKQPEGSALSEIKDLFDLLKNLDVSAVNKTVREYGQLLKDLKGMVYELREEVRKLRDSGNPPAI